MLKDPKFCELFLRILTYNLNGREIKYLLWKFYYRKTDKEIAKLDGRCESAGVNLIINNAYRKIRHDFRKL